MLAQSSIHSQSIPARASSLSANYFFIMSFEERAQQLGLVSSDVVKGVLQEHPNGGTILDVRSLKEIEDTGKFEVPGYKWVQVAVMPGDVAELTKSSAELIPDKDAPVILYCQSGRRASFAKTALEEQGYKKVLNAGGYTDIVGLKL